MAARKRKAARREPEVITAADEALEDIELDEIEELQEFLVQFGATLSKCQILKIEGNEPQYCETVPASGLTQDMIREKWGYGKFRLRFLTTGNRYAKTLTVNLARPVNGAAAGAVVHTGGSATGEAFLREQATMQQNLILALIAGFKPAPPLDIGGLLAGVAAMSNKGPDAAGMLTAVITAFTALKGAASPDGGLDLKKLKEVMDVVQQFTPKAPTEENLYTVAKELGNKAIETVREWKAGPPALQAAPGEQPAAGAPAQTTMTVQEWIKAQLVFLKSKAAAGKDPEAWIDYLFDNQEEPGCSGILQAVHAGATFEQLLQFDAEISQNPTLTAWFKTVYDGIHAEFTKPLDTAGESGNNRDAANDAAPSDGSKVTS